MNKFEIKIINEFTQLNIEKCFISNFLQLKLADAIKGMRQPDNATIVGFLKKIQRRTLKNNNQTVIKLILNENENGVCGIPFEALIYGKYVTFLEELLRRAGEVDILVIFYDSFFMNYTGLSTIPWSDITLKIDERHNFNPGVTLVLQQADLKRSNLTEMEISALLNSCEINLPEVAPIKRIFNIENIDAEISSYEVYKNLPPKSIPSAETTAELLSQHDIAAEVVEVANEHMQTPIAVMARLSPKFTRQPKTVNYSPYKQVNQRKSEKPEDPCTTVAPRDQGASSTASLPKTPAAQVGFRNSSPPPQSSSPRGATASHNLNSMPCLGDNLNSVEGGKYYTLFVVVREVVKQTSVLANGSRHTVLALIDPSCLQPGALREDLLLQIFFNDPKDNFKNAIEVSDILKIEKMKGDNFRKENKVHGILLSSKSIIQFKFDNNFIIPVTTHKDYKFTAEDRKCVIFLKKWWEETKVITQSAEVEPPVKRIKSIEGSCLFNISCKVTKTKVAEESSEVVLCVTDGTAAVIYTATFSFDEATGSWLPDTGSLIYGATEIEILIFSPLQEEAKRIKIGDFVFLTNVNCFECEQLGSKKSTARVYAFRIESVEATLAKVLPQGSRACKIKRALEESSSIDPMSKKK